MMKKIMLLVVMGLYCVCGQAQFSHLSFMGFPMNERLETFMEKLRSVGFVGEYKDDPDCGAALIEMKGSYRGKYVTLHFNMTRKSKLVYSVNMALDKPNATEAEARETFNLWKTFLVPNPGPLMILDERRSRNSYSEWLMAGINSDVGTISLYFGYTQKGSVKKDFYVNIEFTDTQNFNLEVSEGVVEIYDGEPAATTPETGDGNPTEVTTTTNTPQDKPNENEQLTGNGQPNWNFILYVAPPAGHITREEAGGRDPYIEEPMPKKKGKRTDEPHQIIQWPIGPSSGNVYLGNEEEQPDSLNEQYCGVNAIEFVFALFLRDDFSYAHDFVLETDELCFNTSNDKKTYFSANRTIGDKENVWIERTDKKSNSISKAQITVHKWEDDEIIGFIKNLGFEQTNLKDDTNDIVPSITRTYTSEKYPFTINFVTFYSSNGTLKTVEFKR